MQSPANTFELFYLPLSYLCGHWVWTRCPWKIFWILPLPNSCSLLVCRIQASLDLTFVPCLCQHWAWSLRKRTNPNKSTTVKRARVGRAVPCVPLDSAALNRGVCALYGCLSKKKSMVEPCNAEQFPKCSRCHHPCSVVPCRGYLLWTLPPGHLSSENSYYSYDSAVNKTGSGALGPEAKLHRPAISALYGLWPSGTIII